MAKTLFSSIILAGDLKPPDPLVSLLASHCDETILVAAEPLRHLDYDGLIVADAPMRHHPYSAIYAGLFAAQHDHALVVDGQRPDLKPELLQGLLDAVEPRWDLVIANPETGLDPCLAVYSRRCLKPLAQHLDRIDFNAKALFSKLNKHVLEKPVLNAWDPEGISFNTTDSTVA